MKRILIVEDDVTMNKMLSNMLLTEGYQVTSAVTKAEAQRYLLAAPFDMAILDVNLPDGSGYEVCKAIREKAYTAVIFLTANDLEYDMIKGYELGAADYITKPFSNRVLRHKVKAIFTLLETVRQEPAHRIYEDGRLMIDFSSRKAALNGKEIEFAPLEYRMQAVGMTKRQFTREFVWNNLKTYGLAVLAFIPLEFAILLFAMPGFSVKMFLASVCLTVLAVIILLAAASWILSEYLNRKSIAQRLRVLE